MDVCASHVNTKPNNGQSYQTNAHLCRRLWSVVVGDVVLDDGRRRLTGGPMVSNWVGLRSVVLRWVQLWRNLWPLATAGDRHVLIRRAEVALSLRLHVWGIAEVAPHLVRAAFLALAVAVAAEAPAPQEEHNGANNRDDDLVRDALSIIR